jgi:hypothetical protein
MSIIKFSISSSYQFNTSNIILSFKISGNQTLSYEIGNVTVFSSPNYNNVKLYTREELIKMMNSAVQPSIKMTTINNSISEQTMNNSTAALPTVNNTSSSSQQNFTSNSTSSSISISAINNNSNT